MKDFIDFKIVGAGKRTDETYTGELIGTVNVTKLRALAETNNFEPYQFEITDNVKEGVRKIITNQAHIDAMPMERLLVPLIFVAKPGGTHILVDGAHRLKKAMALGLPCLWTYMIPEWAAERFRIRVYGLTRAGVWHELSGLEVLEFDKDYQRQQQRAA